MDLKVSVPGWLALGSEERQCHTVEHVVEQTVTHLQCAIEKRWGSHTSLQSHTASDQKTSC